jgi:hypothetical protein
MRAQLDPNLVSVLPSAIDTDAFVPRPDLVDPEYSQSFCVLAYIVDVKT